MGRTRIQDGLWSLQGQQGSIKLLTGGEEGCALGGRLLCHLISPVLGLGAPLLLGYFSVGMLTYPIHVESSLQQSLRHHICSPYRGDPMCGPRERMMLQGAWWCWEQQGSHSKRQLYVSISGQLAPGARPVNQELAGD